MSKEFEGACHCGSVQYSCTAASELTFFCHCNDCQRTTGSPFSVELMIPSKAFEVQGELNTYTVVGDSGQEVHRRFCPRCASGVYLECDAYPGYIFLKAGTLKDASWVKPEMHIYTAAKQPWVVLGDNIPQFEKAPDD